MTGPPVTGEAVPSAVFLIGQAPGNREIEVHKPFAWTAGKTLFSWFATIGADEEWFRSRVYMAAVCRCFPGKKPGGGDRVPSRAEITNCEPWLTAELRQIKPRLILPVGKLAIGQWLPVRGLAEVVGKCHPVEHGGGTADLIALPHPSGASTWHRTEPGRSLLHRSLQLIAAHPAWRSLQD